MRTVSTWSLHRTLGSYVSPDSGVLGGACRAGASEPVGLALLDLPAALREHGYDTLQICHFHLPSRSPEYLASLRGALDDAGITLDGILVDDGDLTDADHADQTEAWMGTWLRDAAALRANRVRLMVGGGEPTPGIVREVAGRLSRLAAENPDVRIVIENWTGVLRDADSVQGVLEAVNGSIGLLIDLGNWRGPDRFTELERIAPLAETCHAKCRFIGSEPDTDEFQQGLRILRDTDYTGPMALIYDGVDDDEWAKLDRIDALCREVFG